MRDDEIDEMLQTLKAAGVSEAQVRRTLDVLGRVEELGAELSATLPPYKRQKVQETLAVVMQKIFESIGASVVIR